MEVEQLTENVEIIQTLSDYPNTDQGLTPAELKKKFDEGSRILKEYLNSTVVPAINKNGRILKEREPLKVSISVQSGLSNYTASQILNARSNGQDVCLEFENSRLSLLSVTAEFAVFVNFSGASSWDRCLIDDSGTVTRISESVSSMTVTIDWETGCASQSSYGIQAHAEAGGAVCLDVDSCLIPLSWVDTNNIAFFERFVPADQLKVSYLIWDDGAVEKITTKIATADDLSTAIQNAEKKTIDKLCPSFSESGTAVRCEPVEGYPLSITAEEGATTISRCGKNLIDYTQAAPRNDTQIVNILGNGVEWAVGNHYFAIPCDIKAGAVVVFSCVDEADAINGIILYDSKTKTECSSLNGKGKETTAKADADTARVYKRDPTVQITTPIVITNLQLEYGTIATAYEPYKSVETFAPGEIVPALSGVNTIWADSGEITVLGRADPVAIIEKLTNAIISLGGNV